MKKVKSSTTANAGITKKGYNEKNPGQPQGAFPPDASHAQPGTKSPKSNTADKKKKEDQE